MPIEDEKLPKNFHQKMAQLENEIRPFPTAPHFRFAKNVRGLFFINCIKKLFVSLIISLNHFL